MYMLEMGGEQAATIMSATNTHHHLIFDMATTIIITFHCSLQSLDFIIFVPNYYF